MLRLFRALVCAFALFSSLLGEESFVIDNRDSLLMPNTIGFIENLSLELFTKTSFSLYVAVVDKTPQDIQSPLPNSHLEKYQNDTQKLRREIYKDSLRAKAREPYAILIFMKQDKKIDILSSHPKDYFNEDKVYFEYMIPLLPKSKEEPLNAQRISAILLNGYAEAADMIAHHYGVNLQNNMPVDERGGRAFVKFCMYVMLLVMFGLLGLIYLRRNQS